MTIKNSNKGLTKKQQVLKDEVNKKRAEREELQQRQKDIKDQYNERPQNSN